MSQSKPVLCIDIGGTSTKLGVFDGQQEVPILASIPTSGPAGRFVNNICESVDNLLTEKHLTWDDLAGAGVAVAGFLDDDRTRMIYNSNLSWLEHYTLRDHLQRYFRAPVALEVDSNSAALAEQRLGSGRNSRRFLCVTIGTGYGVGMIVDGVPLRFAYGCLGDIGHMVIRPDGPLCGCGGHGCAEVFVSAPLLAESYRERSHSATPLSLRDVIEAARQDDAVAQEILSEAGKWLGVSLPTLANAFYPDHIAIAGGLVEAGHLVMHSVKTHFERSASTFALAQTTLGRAQLGSLATLTGAAFALTDV